MSLDFTPGSPDLTALLRAKYNLAALNVQLAAVRLAQALTTARYNPD